MKTTIKTGTEAFDEFFPKVRTFLEKDTLDVVIDGKKIRGYRSPDAKSIWIRDYSDMIRGFKYFETDLRSTIDHFAETQAANGRIFDYFTTFPEKLPCERENWTKYVRVPVEADVEYRFVKAAYLAWQATGDDLWVEHLLPRMEKALHYIMSHPWRWDEEVGMVKRAYTIDTWDFAYSRGKHDWLQFQIDKDTVWGFMHGDNSGYFEAFEIMSILYDYFGQAVPAGIWRKRAQQLKMRMNTLCWNGRFYSHFVKRTPFDIPGVNEELQLSLSNPMDINRGVATHAMAVSIINEYMQRKNKTSAFAEWFSIDPPFPDGIFGDEKLKKGAYVNGGIMPLVGGELARAAFDHGYEAYGVDILNRYFKLISETGKTYLWYFPDGSAATIETSTSPEAEPTDGWGSSAMLYALIEGLAGVEDRLKQFKKVRLSPRWVAAGINQAEVRVVYACSQTTFQYHFNYDKSRIHLEMDVEKSDVQFHVLLPQNMETQRVITGHQEVKFQTVKVEKSRYVDFTINIQDQCQVTIALKKV